MILSPGGIAQYLNYEMDLLINIIMTLYQVDDKNYVIYEL